MISSVIGIFIFNRTLISIIKYPGCLLNKGTVDAFRRTTW